MFSLRRIFPFLIPLLVFSFHAMADEPPDETTQLRERVDVLETRLAEMEALVRALKTAQELPEPKPDTVHRTPVTENVSPAAPQPAPAGVPLQAYFNRGLQLRSADGAFDIRVGGRIQLDTSFFDVDERWERLAALYPEYGLGKEDDGVAFRRARLSIRGTIYENIGFKAQYDFAVDSPGNDGGQFRDVYIELLELPFVDKARIGHFQEPFSLEEITSNSYMTFMERSLANVFVPSFNTGLTVEKSMLSKRLHWTLGIFKTTDFWPSDNDSNEAAGYGVTGRITGVPWKAEDGDTFVHLGASFNRRNPDGEITFRQRPESFLAQRYVNTGPLETTSLFTYGLEAAIVRGPLSLQGEYISTEINTELYGRRDFSGYYGAASWFITGEHRPYVDGAFSRVIPKAAFRLGGDQPGWGAWELALRYSYLDLNDGPVQGGSERNITAGINWYLNANTRIMANYIYAQPDNLLYDGDLKIFQTRFQVDF